MDLCFSSSLQNKNVLCIKQMMGILSHSESTSVDFLKLIFLRCVPGWEKVLLESPLWNTGLFSENCGLVQRMLQCGIQVLSLGLRHLMAQLPGIFTSKDFQMNLSAGLSSATEFTALGLPVSHGQLVWRYKVNSESPCSSTASAGLTLDFVGSALSFSFFLCPILFSSPLTDVASQGILLKCPAHKSPSQSLLPAEPDLR